MARLVACRIDPMFPDMISACSVEVNWTRYLPAGYTVFDVDKTPDWYERMEAEAIRFYGDRARPRPNRPGAA